MVTDRLTDTVYFSKWLLRDFPTVAENLCHKLSRHGIEYGFLNHTKDYWCRDYMPVQVSSTKFVQYQYAPDYLSAPKDKNYITDPSRTLSELGIPTLKTHLIIDGGNVIKSPDKVIMTEKVFYENRDIPREKLISTLEELFECPTVFLPWDRAEKHGHADGIVRWVNGDTVLLTAYEESGYFSRRFRKALEACFDVVEMKFTTHSRHKDLSWAYINFLQTKNVIIVPTFSIAEDEQALQQIERAFPDYQGRIECVDASEVIGHGGGVNCISWNIQSKVIP